MVHISKYTLFFYCCLVGFLWSTTSTLASEKVVLQLKWLHQFQFAGYYAAKEKGYYLDAGFDVEILQRDPKVRPIDAVLNGKADFGVSDSSLILHRMKKKPVVVLGVIFQHSPLVLVTRPEDKLLGPYELKGKRVMFQKGLDDAVLTAMFHQLGIKDDDIIHVPHTFDDNALLKKEVDATSAYLTDQPFYYASKGTNVHIINPLNYGVDFYGDMLFTNEKIVRQNPDRAHRFLEASIRGWQYALANKEEVIGWIKSIYRSKKSIEHLRYEANQTEKMILPRLVKIGYTNVDRFKRIADIYRQENMVHSDATYDGVHFDDYLVPNRRLPLWVKILGIVTVIIFLGSLILFALNRRLNTLVRARTQELATARDEAQIASQAKSEFLSVVSHELRTPLTSIKGALSLLVDGHIGNFSEKAMGMVGIAHRNTNRLITLVNDILDMEKISSGNMEFKFLPLNLSNLVGDAVESNKGYADEHSVKFILAAPSSNISVHGDADRLTQVIANLLSNAAKFSPEKDEVRISVTQIENIAHVEVSDNGPGIPEKYREHIFGRFTQVDSSHARQKGGTGLGLNISKTIIEMHDGEIDYTSEVGIGSTFFFTLPVSE